MDKVYVEIRATLESLVDLNFDHLEELRLVLTKLVDKLVVSMDGEVEIYTSLG